MLEKTFQNNLLRKRTNVLFSDQDYFLLYTLAEKKGVSVGELIRRAIRKTYPLEKEMEERHQTVNQLFSLWKKQQTKTINYKQLVEDGRQR